MKQTFTLLLFSFSFHSFAQTKTTGTTAPPTQLNLSDSAVIDFDPSIQNVGQQPIPAAEYGDKKKELERLRAIKKLELEKIYKI